MALRTTSPAVRLIVGSRRLALCAMPFAATSTIYALGAHHRQERIDWSALPFGSKRAESFELRVPESALSIRELEVAHVRVVGSHTLFVTREISRQTFRREPQLFHVSGLYQRYLDREGRESFAT